MSSVRAGVNDVLTAASGPIVRTVAGVAIFAALAGCAALGSDPKAEPAEFGPVELTVTGGVGGIYERLELAEDGTVLVSGARPVGGRAPERTMKTLRELLTGEEIAGEASSDGPDQDACADGFTYHLRMGTLNISRYDCVEDIEAPTFERVIKLLDPMREGRVEPLPEPPTVPALPAITVTRTVPGGPNLQAAIRPDGAVTITGVPGAATIAAAVGQPQLDAMRMLVPRMVAEPPTGPPKDCGEVGYAYVLAVAGTAPVNVAPCRLADVRENPALGIVHALDDIWPED